MPTKVGISVSVKSLTRQNIGLTQIPAFAGMTEIGDLLKLQNALSVISWGLISKRALSLLRRLHFAGFERLENLEFFQQILGQGR